MVVLMEASSEEEESSKDDHSKDSNAGKVSGKRTRLVFIWIAFIYIRVLF
jgi:hypothetical protein